jgi:FkbM family methyltransferase
MKSIYWRLAPKFKRALLKGLKQSFLLNRLNLTATFSINGVPFRIPVIKGVGYQNVFMTEMWMVEVIKRLLPLKPGAFVDIGANIGQTLLKLRAVSRDTPYLGLEPNPACASYVCEIIRANRFDHTTLVPVGISDARAILELDFFAEGNQTDSGASLVKDPEFRPGHPVVFRQPVPVFPYEDVSTFLRGTPPCLVKIDVEGAELQVLDSMQETIRAHRPLILRRYCRRAASQPRSRRMRASSHSSTIWITAFRASKKRAIASPDSRGWMLSATMRTRQAGTTWPAPMNCRRQWQRPHAEPI